MTPEQVKERAINFCTWFMQLKVDDLLYYIKDEATGIQIPQYYSRSEMYDKYLEINKL